MSLHFDEVRRAVEKAAERGIRRGADVVLAESDDHVPYDTGQLERSGAVSQDGLEAVVAYHREDAVIQHENMRYHHDPGRHAKYLERAANEKRQEIAATVAAEIRRALGT